MNTKSFLALLTLLTPALAVGCYSTGQPFDESWDASRIVTACNAMKGHFDAGQTKTNCQPMGDDQVHMEVHNKLEHAVTLHFHDCKRAMHNIINDCGGHSDPNRNNHGGEENTNVFKYVFNPNEGGC